MSTAGNALTDSVGAGSEGNGLRRVVSTVETISNPTLGSGDGTYDVTVSSVRNIQSEDDVEGVKWDGSQKATLDSISGNTVTVLFESPSGTDSYANEADGTLSGTLTVTVST